MARNIGRKRRCLDHDNTPAALGFRLAHNNPGVCVEPGDEVHPIVHFLEL